MRDIFGPAVRNTLNEVSGGASPLVVNSDSRIVIFSDIHIGDGSFRDDFRINGDLLQSVLRDYYAPREFTLLLNGDIEELHRFSLDEILGAWGELYSVFGSFAKKGRFHKTIGNHDIILADDRDYLFHEFLCEALCLSWLEHALLVFHGHQASIFLRWFNHATAAVLRYVARPLNIRTYSVSRDNLKKFKTESRVFGFSRSKKLISINGHTHRPLFDSLSKVEALQFRIEELCRRYAAAPGDARGELAHEIGRSREVLTEAYRSHGYNGTRRGVYNTQLLVPCLFNAGCCIGKRGITGIEISGERIALVHWYDGRRRGEAVMSTDNEPTRLGNTNYHRLVLNEEDLHYVFTRVDLLS